jgi:hypothetical protein
MGSRTTCTWIHKYAWGDRLVHVGLQPGRVVLQSTCCRAACTALYFYYGVHLACTTLHLLWHAPRYTYYGVHRALGIEGVVESDDVGRVAPAEARGVCVRCACSVRAVCVQASCRAIMLGVSLVRVRGGVGAGIAGWGSGLGVGLRVGDMANGSGRGQGRKEVRRRSCRVRRRTCAACAAP